MPGENGHDLAERLLATRPGLRVLMMSGYDVEPIPTDERLTFLAKPFDRGLLLDAVERALAKPE
jgi:FixJ family two-component response regulator